MIHTRTHTHTGSNSIRTYVCTCDTPCATLNALLKTWTRKRIRTCTGWRSEFHLSAACVRDRVDTKLDQCPRPQSRCTPISRRYLIVQRFYLRASRFFSRHTAHVMYVNDYLGTTAVHCLGRSPGFIVSPEVNYTGNPRARITVLNRARERTIIHFSRTIRTVSLKVEHARLQTSALVPYNRRTRIIRVPINTRVDVCNPIYSYSKYSSAYNTQLYVYVYNHYYDHKWSFHKVTATIVTLYFYAVHNYFAYTPGYRYIGL